MRRIFSFNTKGLTILVEQDQESKRYSVTVLHKDSTDPKTIVRFKSLAEATEFASTIMEQAD